jgi:uncharacterized protein YsxB (DUF464 family)
VIKASFNAKKIKISGHALFDTKGKDIVCAAISAIVIGSINAFKSFKQDEINIQNGKVEIKIEHELTHDDKIRLKMLITEIETVAKKYPKNVSIIKNTNFLKNL